ncbi:16S rRNA (guanine(527)-N(7))-methyltransferase RsmG [Gorillibacterium sp. sgz5001074]|uniref:16S rRNA (guanine(527)-N(7))-methyltransferase RsmG n=1 Tax=Gorillibacterium sp. sgz5001074 TaxID=3446695 RepID=UPI003F67D684
MDAVQEQFVSMLQEKGLTLTERQLEQFESYYRELVEWNEKMNLTAITDREQVYLKHFYDSLTLSFHVALQDVETMADIGAGAGFPSLPNKIAYPHLKLTIVDSLNKRIHFLQHLVAVLGLDQVSCIHARAEEAGRDSKLRDRFDLTSARAVARLNVLNELCLPFVKQGGAFAAMKGAQSAEEVEEAKASIKLLNAKLEKVATFELPVEQAERNIVVLRKTGGTPAKYPRKPGTPSKDPIR